MTLKELIKKALDETSQNGWTPASIAFWANEFRKQASATVFNKSPESVISPYLNNLFKKEITDNKLLERNPGIDRFTLERIKPQFRRILEDRIRANINLIVLERPASIEISTARFSGWLMSFDGKQAKLPPADELPVFQNITKPMLDQKSYEHSRRAIDQGHKMIRAIDLTIAEQGGAIAAIWHAHKTTAYFTARPDHWKRDGEIYVFKNSDIADKGLVKKGPNVWLEDIPDPPALLINCVCYWEFIYSVSTLAKLAPDRITQKGRDLLATIGK